mmetsp:Transcript_116788/g.371709  ORF Transcript_116788/g.371709 Transcript_116788/m.371709 type:complete len:216 (+) Transcript_116788:251-898(+)
MPGVQQPQPSKEHIQALQHQAKAEKAALRLPAAQAASMPVHEIWEGHTKLGGGDKAQMEHQVPVGALECRHDHEQQAAEERIPYKHACELRLALGQWDLDLLGRRVIPKQIDHNLPDAPPVLTREVENGVAVSAHHHGGEKHCHGHQREYDRLLKLRLPLVRLGPEVPEAESADRALAVVLRPSAHDPTSSLVEAELAGEGLGVEIGGPQEGAHG